MKSATLQGRKRFAAELAELAAACVEARPPERQVEPERHRRPTVAEADAALAYRMRRWWLDNYTRDEIRELGECLR